MKKILSLLLALVLCASAGASAANGSITVDDIAVPDVTFPNDEPAQPSGDSVPDVDFPQDTGNDDSGTVSSVQAAPAHQEEMDDFGAMMDMAGALSALLGEEITQYPAVETRAAGEIAPGDDFSVTLHVLEPLTSLYVVLEEIAAFTAEAPVSEYMGAEFMEAALPLLPEDADPAALVLDELYEMTVENDDPAYGDVEAAFEFVTQYPDETVLLAAACVLPAPAAGEDADAPAEDGDAAAPVLWLPMQAAAAEGRVRVLLSRQVLEAANAGEQVVGFALLRLETEAE